MLFTVSFNSYNIQNTVFPGFGSLDLASLGLPARQEYIQQYSQLMGLPGIDNWDLYASFICFRFAAILQGVYKRSLQG